MQANVDNAQITARNPRRRNTRRIGSDTCDPVVSKQRLDFVGEPRLVSRLEHRIAVEAPAQLSEKSCYNRTVKLKAWRQLNQDRAAFVAESGGFVQEPIEKCFSIYESLLVRDCLR